MVLKFHAKFDGETLRPEEPVNLKPNERYSVTVEAEPAPAKADEPAEEPYILTRIAALARDMGVTDLAEHHKEYARGLRKFPEKLDDSADRAVR